MHKVMDSNDARLHWRDVLDAGAKGLDIVITRYNKPVSVVIDYEDYLAIVEQLEDQRAGRRAAATLELIEQDPTRVRPFQSLVAELIEEGELDASVVDKLSRSIRSRSTGRREDSAPSGPYYKGTPSQGNPCPGRRTHTLPTHASSKAIDDLFRLRVGDWRIIYQIIDDQLLILVLEIGSRGEIYRNY